MFRKLVIAGAAAALLGPSVSRQPFDFCRVVRIIERRGRRARVLMH
jgi:hypothetical protein